MDFITAEEKQQLERKLEQMTAKRPELSQRIGEARALGDLSENAEYHAAREEQGLLEAEIRRIELRLKKAKVADTSIVPQDMVFLGSIVMLRDLESGTEDRYRLVGESSGNFNIDSDEIEVTAGSPMGEALMKARVGDAVKVDLPHGTKRFEVVQIQ
jgi:transcription elongation factor GreA